MPITVLNQKKKKAELELLHDSRDVCLHQSFWGPVIRRIGDEDGRMDGKQPVSPLGSLI